MDSIRRAKSDVLSLLVLIAVFRVPAFGQTDFSGEWFPLAHEDREVDRRGGAAIGDYTGLPINDAARLRADNYDAAVFTLPEWQCRPHGVDFIPLGLSELRIWKEIDPVTQQFVAWRMHWLRSANDRAIYMDGRPHPPEYAAHTWEGFSTGKWEGNMLRITTTHMKEDYLRRNGVSRSSFATLSELLFLHGDYLTWTTIIYDPAYLTEPMIRNASYIRVPHQQMPAYPCPVVVEVVRPKGSVPHHLPGKNPYLTEFAEKAGIPFEVTRGGAETIYPEYQLKGLADRVYAQQFRNAAENAELHIWPVHGNVYVLVGAGGNITLSVGKDGVLVVDSGNVAMSDRVLAAIEQFTRQRDPNGPPLPIRYIINTQVDSDHTGGNAAITASGLFKPLEGGEEIIAHDNVLKRMNETGNQAARAKPTDTYLTGQYKVNRFFNGEGVQVIHMPAAHTDGDSIVWFRFSDVISTGDIFTDSYPVIDLQRGGSIQGIIDALNRTIDLVFPEFRSQGGTMLIPGHGRLCDLTELAYYRDMVTIIRDRVQDMIKRGMMLEQVKAAKLTVDFDPIYGRNPGSSETFVEAVYRSLSQTR